MKGSRRHLLQVELVLFDFLFEGRAGPCAGTALFLDVGYLSGQRLDAGGGGHQVTQLLDPVLLALQLRFLRPQQRWDLRCSRRVAHPCELHPNAHTAPQAAAPAVGKVAQTAKVQAPLEDMSSELNAARTHESLRTGKVGRPEDDPNRSALSGQTIGGLSPAAPLKPKPGPSRFAVDPSTVFSIIISA